MSAATAATASDELIGLLADGKRNAKGPYPSARERTPEQLDEIRSLITGLEAAGAGVRYLDGEKYAAQWRLGPGVGSDPKSEALYDSYEVAFFDGSVDGGGSSGGRSNTTSASRSLRSRVLRALFSLRFSLQHVRAPNVAVNDVGFRFCGLPASVITKASFTRLNASAVAALNASVHLRDDTTFRLDFERPRLVLGPRSRPLLSFEIGPSSAQARVNPKKGGLPPVNLCTTYLDDRLRLGLATKGTKLVFTRGGLASEPWAAEWEAALATRPTNPKLALATAAAALLGLVVPAARKWAWLGTAAVWSVRLAEAQRERVRQRQPKPPKRIVV